MDGWRGALWAWVGKHPIPDPDTDLYASYISHISSLEVSRQKSNIEVDSDDCGDGEADSIGAGAGTETGAGAGTGAGEVRGTSGQRQIAEELDAVFCRAEKALHSHKERRVHSCCWDEDGGQAFYESGYEFTLLSKIGGENGG